MSTGMAQHTLAFLDGSSRVHRTPWMAANQLSKCPFLDNAEWSAADTTRVLLEGHQKTLGTPKRGPNGHLVDVLRKTNANSTFSTCRRSRGTNWC